MWKHIRLSLPKYALDFLNQQGLKPGEVFISTSSVGMIDIFYFDRSPQQEEAKG